MCYIVRDWIADVVLYRGSTWIYSMSDAIGSESLTSDPKEDVSSSSKTPDQNTAQTPAHQDGRLLITYYLHWHCHDHDISCEE